MEKLAEVDGYWTLPNINDSYGNSRIELSQCLDEIRECVQIRSKRGIVINHFNVGIGKMVLWSREAIEPVHFGK
jgi:hypothetical protein